MSLVVPLADCRARPDGPDGRVHGLVAHLESVASFTTKVRSRFPGCPDYRYLAALLHDAGKARTSWQEYVMSRSAASGPPHAAYGSCLFFYLSTVLTRARRRISSSDYHHIVQYSRLIADHHGQLDDLSADPPWGSVSLRGFEEMDLEGLLQLVRTHFGSFDASVEGFLEWFPNSFGAWERAFVHHQIAVSHTLDGVENRFEAAARIVFPDDASILVAGDRFDAAELSQSGLDGNEALLATRNLIARCHEQTVQDRAERAAMSSLRQSIQDQATRNYLNRSDNRIYSLILPTGTGKTLTALRIALTSVSMGKTERVIYVAPYLSILSQAYDQIRTATNLDDVIIHHHLSGLDRLDADERVHLAMESWQAQVVCTTFNQLFRALFPRKAQETLRLFGLRNSFLIVDEPQILDPDSWNLFLRMIETAANSLELQVLFVTATFPEWKFGLTQAPVPLAPNVPCPERYSVRILPQTMDEHELADMGLETLTDGKSTCIIVNTVKDAVLVYESFPERAPGDVDLYILSGAMTPLHKTQRIIEIQDALKDADRKVLVVCTQIIEAGVDLSFDSLIRVKSVLPSIVQASGRANRHGDARTPARVYVTDFLRNGEKDTRPYVYRSSLARGLTDEMLSGAERWSEADISSTVSEYYRRLFDHNSFTVSCEKLVQAATGKTSALGGSEPFQSDIHQVSVFVYWTPGRLPENVSKALDRFGCATPEELYELYLDRDFIRRLTFAQRRGFGALVQQFTVPVDLNARELFTYPRDDISIPVLADPGLYNDRYGLAHFRGRKCEEPFIL